MAHFIMEVKVAFTTQLKATLGKGEASLSLESGSHVRDAISALAKRYPREFSQLVLDGQQRLLPSILLCVNDQQVEFSHEVPLADGDTLTLLSAISGG